jgi:hypothetical protein
MRERNSSWSDSRRVILCLIAGAVIAACSETSAPDVTPPTVTAAIPVEGSVAVATGINVSATFSEAMDPTTVTTSTVTLKRTTTGAAVAGTVSYTAATRTVSFTPAAPLLNTTAYTFAINTGAKDAAGNAMTSSFSSSFTTVQIVSGAPYFQGTDVGDKIHFHIRFTQSGQTVGLPTDCQPLPLADCEIFPLNQAGADAIGPASPNQNGGSIITAVSGTFNDPNITFTFTIANGRTFTYTGTVSGSTKMTGTVSGASFPSAALVLER